SIIDFGIRLFQYLFSNPRYRAQREGKRCFIAIKIIVKKHSATRTSVFGLDHFLCRKSAVFF
ncbi:MAG: hypothetical protein ACKVIH_08025, partial [Burkholderiales bacterium]